MALRHDDLVAALPGLHRYALTLTRDPADAEDLVQDVAVRSIERAEEFRGEASAATWLHRVMYRRFVDRRRATREVATDPASLAEAVERAWRSDEYTVDSARVVSRAETAEELREALVHLPSSYRSAIVLHDVEGWTAQQVADVHEVSLSAAKQRIRRGRAMLVTELARDDERRRALKGVPMRCWDARSNIDDYLDGDLDQSLRAALEEHLATCPTCPSLYAALVGVRGALGRLRDPDSVVPPRVAQRVREALPRP